MFCQSLTKKLQKKKEVNCQILVKLPPEIQSPRQKGKNLMDLICYNFPK